MSIWTFTILWYLFCIGIIVDTRFFVYLTLSQTLVGGILLLVLASFAIIVQIGNKSFSRLHFVQYLVLIWMGYLLLHALFMREAENYKLMYLEETLLLMLVLPNLLELQILSKRTLENSILLICAIQLGSLTMQFVGFANSYNDFFSITGLSDNPNVSAILLAVCIPTLYSRMKRSNRRLLWTIPMLLSILFIVLLKCRTAYIFLITVFAVRMILSDSVKLFWSKRSFFGKSSLIVVSFLTLLVFGLLFYRTKQASSEGRLLIWKVSTKMIQEHPTGIGIGMFEHDYNLRQGEYFASGESTERERYNSGTVNMAYNDFLEHCVEAGIPGFLFIISFYVYLMFLTYRRKDTELFSYFSAVFLISWLNFIYSSIQPWIVLMTYASIAISQDINMEPKRNGIANKVIALGLLLL